MEDLLKRYQQEYADAVKIDDLNMEEQLRKLPTKKQYFLCRYIDAKIDRDKLEKKLKSSIIKAQDKIAQNAPVALTNRELNSNIDNLESVQDIREKLKELDYVIEFLDMVVKQIAFITNDFKNVVEYKKIQELG